MAFYDEVFTPSGDPRPHTEALAGALSELGPGELADAGRRRDAIFMQQGITFDAGGPDADGPVRDRPFPLDLVPRVIPAAEWRQIKRGLAQRIRALESVMVGAPLRRDAGSVAGNRPRPGLRAHRRWL